MEHVTWVISTITFLLAEALGLEIENQQSTESPDIPTGLKSKIEASYELLRSLLWAIDDNMLDEVVGLPPPARLRKGSVERILRIMMGYHVVHHAGQVAMLLRIARETNEGND